jgi:hypothetical protein
MIFGRPGLRLIDIGIRGIAFADATSSSKTASP